MRTVAVSGSRTRFLRGGLAAGDLDGDGDADLIVGDAFTASKGVLLNDGRGGFEAHPFTGGGSTIALALGDLDGDGDADCISAFASVFIHLNNGDATFAPAQPFGPLLPATAVCIAHVNTDSHLDVAVLRSSTSVNHVGVFLNTGRDAVFTFVAYPVDTLGRDIAAADLDADGDLDIATSHVSSINRVNVLRNDGSGAFAAAGSFFPGIYPQSLTIADFDQDGLNDIATANEFANPPNVGMLFNDTIVKSIGDVTLDGQVNVDDLIAVILAWGPCPPPPCAADIAPHAAGDGEVNVDDLVLVIINWTG